MKTQTIFVAACAALQFGISALAAAEPIAIIVSSKNANSSINNDLAEKIFSRQAGCVSRWRHGGATGLA